MIESRPVSKTTTFLFCVLLLAVAASASAQTVSAEPRLGIGISISDIGELIPVLNEDAIAATVVPGVMIPIRITSRLRVEPDIGGYSNSSTSTVQGISNERRYSFFRAGAGVFWMTRRDRVTLYFGGRAAYLRYTQSSVTSGRQSVTYPTIPGKLFAPTIGADYRLADHFTIGGEVQVRFVSWDTVSTASTFGIPSTISGSSVSTNAAFTLRFFF